MLAHFECPDMNTVYESVPAPTSRAGLPTRVPPSTQPDTHTARQPLPPRARARALLVDQPPVHRPAAQLVAARELKLAQHCGDVRLDGLRRNTELGGDLLVHVATRDVLQHLALARCQQVELRVHLRGRDLTGERVEHEACQAW